MPDHRYCVGVDYFSFVEEDCYSTIQLKSRAHRSQNCFQLVLPLTNSQSKGQEWSLLSTTKLVFLRFYRSYVSAVHKSSVASKSQMLRRDFAK